MRALFVGRPLSRMEKVLQGLVVGVKDRGDFDKYLTLITEEGKKNCMIKGVRRASSKLRFAGELFSLCEFTLVSGHGVPVVTNAYHLSLNYELRTDYERFLAAAAVARLSEEFCAEQDETFLPFLLASLEFVKADERLGLVRFVLGLFERSGYALDLSVCAVCGGKIGEKAFYSTSASGLTCAGCGGQPVRAGVLDLLRRAQSGTLSETGEQADFTLGALRLLAYHLNGVSENAGVLDETLAAFKKII